MNPSETRRATSEAEARFEACFRTHYAEVLAYALRRLSERDAAEDVAAQTFGVAWRRLDVLPADPLPWLFGVARQVIRNESRSERRRARLVTRIIGQHRTASAPDPADSLGARSCIADALDRLKRPTRGSLAGCVGGSRLRPRGRGARMRRVRVALHRARRRLAKELAASGHRGPLTEMAREESG